ncbi:MAG: hypothetical protein NC120_00820 [Ruminococcus sp.]|nr:hypothetical protein [Ruminococcus sp.]
MRVTTKAQTGSYLKNSNSLLSAMLSSQQKILSQKKFKRASEDSTSAAKAAHVRKALANLDIYDENCKNAKDLFYAAEKVLYDVANKTYLDVQQKVTEAQDTKDQTQLNILAQEIQEMAEHMLKDMNTDFAGRQMFGSTSSDKTPFEDFSRVEIFVLDDNGEYVPFEFQGGNELDTVIGKDGKAEDPQPNFFRMSEDCFYDENGNKVEKDDVTVGQKLFAKDGTEYPVTMGADGKFINTISNEEYEEVYTDSHKYYDSKGVVIDDLDSYEGDLLLDDEGNPIYDDDGKAIRVYYDGPKIDTANCFKINGSFDASGAIKDRVICYNDVPVSLQGEDLLKVVNGGKIVCYNGAGKVSEVKEFKSSSATRGDANAFPGSNPIYVDIGLGVDYSTPAKLDATALNMALNGAQITGYGTDKDGDSKNLIQLCYDAASALRAGDREAVNRFIDKLDAANTKVLNAITDLGIKQNDMDFYVDKNEVYRLSLEDKQNDLEGTDIEREITNWKTIMAAYNASLSMGSSSLPKSLFDFI